MSIRVFTFVRARDIGALALAVACMLALLVAPALAGEISDDDDRVAKVVIAVNTDPERDPALITEGETFTVYEGDYVTFRIGLNDDQDRPQFDRIAQIRDTFEAERFELVEFRSEFGHACDDPDETGGPGTLECQITLGVDGNAALWMTMRTLAIGDAQTDENGCLATRNTLHSAHPSGTKHADLEVCPAAQRPDDASTPPPTWPPPGVARPSTPPAATAGPSGSGAPTASDQAGGSIPDTSAGGAEPIALVVAGALVLLSLGALAMPPRRARTTD